MQEITTQAQEKSLELAVRTQNAVTRLVERTVARMRDEEGQTIVEYAAILVFVGVLFAALMATPLKTKIGDWAKAVIDKIDKGV
jgi:Flp pilus assembly pilin Flp